MAKEKEETLLVHAVSNSIKRGGPNIKEIEVKTLTNNVNIFLKNIEKIIEKSPQDVGKFKFTELIVAAEISASGKLVIVGSGVEASAKGSLTFKFQKVH